MSRAQRLFDFLSVLRARGRTTVAELAEDLEVSTRTIHRDLASLKELGVPVITEPGRYGGVFVLPGGKSPISGLSTREKDLLQIGGLDVHRAAELGQESLAVAALGKLSTRLNQDDGSRASLPLSQVVTVDNRPWFSGASRSVDVAELAQDLRTGNRLVIRYRKSGERNSTERIVDPYGVLGRGGRWYLIADRGGTPRQYALERLESWDVVDAPRRLRRGETLDSVVSALAQQLESPKNTVAVTAELDQDRLDLARRILGARLVEVEQGSDESAVRITVSYTDIGGVRQLLQFGNSIEVIAPAAARQLTVALARSVLARYRDDGEAHNIDRV